ncbi:hypothetical protein DFH09DRAFT_1280887 [Mycena vulgaris]|nr:hypothetical protein DFH09DRAFT_1280887 [Mycena vulgaris]
MSSPTASQIRLKNIVTCLGAAVNTLEVISRSLETPFLQPISSTIQSLLVSVQIIRKSHDDCTQMLEQIHELLYAIIRLHITSDTSGELSPNMLRNLGKFTETLHKIHTFVEAQQEKSKIKKFFRQGEISKLLKNCHAGLAEAFDLFKRSNNMLKRCTRKSWN